MMAARDRRVPDRIADRVPRDRGAQQDEGCPHHAERDTERKREEFVTEQLCRA